MYIFRALEHQKVALQLKIKTEGVERQSSRGAAKASTEMGIGAPFWPSRELWGLVVRSPRRIRFGAF